MSERFVAQDGTVITYSQGKVDIEKKPVADVLWKPENGELYYRVSSYGNVDSPIWDGDNFDLFAFEMGNVYPTEAQAEAAMKKQTAAMKIKRWIAEANQGWAPDWEDKSQEKFFLYPGYESRVSFTDCILAKHQDNAYYMKSREIALQLLKELPEECELIFGINS